MRHSIFLMNPIGSVEKTWGRFLNEAYLRRTYLRPQTLMCTAGKWRLHLGILSQEISTEPMFLLCAVQMKNRRETPVISACLLSHSVLIVISDFPSECACTQNSSIGIHQAAYQELGLALEYLQDGGIIGFLDGIHDEISCLAQSSEEDECLGR